MGEQNGESGRPILVLGATGKTGRRVVQRLETSGWPVRRGSRSGDPPFDWEDESTWPAVLDGASAAYITFQPDLAVPGADQKIDRFTNLAVGDGVRHLVLLSGRGEPEAEVCEQIVANSGVDWTVLRSSWFAQNFTESYLLEPVRSGYVALPAGDTPVPFVDAEDIADVAVAALTGEGHAGTLYEVTGPRLITFPEAIAEIASAAGRDITYVQLSPDEFTADLTQQGVPAEFIGLLNYLFATVLDGRNAHITDGVQRALGRRPRDFSEFVRQAAASGVWDEPETD